MRSFVLPCDITHLNFRNLISAVCWSPPGQTRVNYFLKKLEWKFLYMVWGKIFTHFADKHTQIGAEAVRELIYSDLQKSRHLARQDACST